MLHCVLKRINGHNCSIKQGEILRQSILKKAFEGKLVSQEANDEPAEVLLQR
jgi:type I restriction enzyme S subunit